MTLFKAEEMVARGQEPRIEWKNDTVLRRCGTPQVKYWKLSAVRWASVFADFHSARVSARMDLMRSPVLILTGHFSWHIPSAAHVASPW